MGVHLLDLLNEFFSFYAKEWDHRSIHYIKFNSLLRPLHVSKLNHLVQLFLEFLILFVEEFVP